MDFERLAAAIAGLRLPTLVVLEGGYATDALGANVSAFLSGMVSEQHGTGEVA